MVRILKLGILAQGGSGFCWYWVVAPQKEENIMEKLLTEKAMTFKANGWLVRKVHLSACHVIVLEVSRPGSNNWLLLGRYEY